MPEIASAGRLGAALICALGLSGCVDGPMGQSGGLGFAGDAGDLSPAAPALRVSVDAAAITAAEPAQALAHVPLPVARPVDVSAGTKLNVAELTKAARAAPAPAAPAVPAFAALTLIGDKPAAAPAPKVQLASLFVEGLRQALPASAALGRGGAMEKQTERVDTSCFPTSLKDVLADISQHFGQPVMVTSGYRSAGENRHAGGARHSYHVQCLAADVQIAGIAPGDIARYARTLDAVGGVGRYGHTKSVHVDVGERKFSWYGLHRRRRG